MVDLKVLQDMHPTWKLVDVIEGPQGQGLIALGADGGVFALDSAGGTTGPVAPLAHTASGAFSYTTLPEGDRKAGVGFAKGGIAVLPNGGYRLTNANQQTYDFNAPPPAPLTQAGPVNITNTEQATNVPATGANDVSGSGALHAFLDPLGLGNLADDALKTLHGTPGATADYITGVWLPQQDSFKKAFPEIAAAQEQVAKGIDTHIPTPGEIVTYRQTAKTLADQGVIPPEFVTDDKLSKLILGGVSNAEFQRRVMAGYSQLVQADPAAREAFMAYHPAIDISHAVGALLDPTLNSAAVDRAIAQAGIGGAAIRSGFGPIGLNQADTLAGAGESAAAAQSDFTRLRAGHSLYDETLIGETPGVNRDTALSSITNADAAAALERRSAQRGAGFQGGGGAGQTSGRGGTGLGNAQP